jgi:hypothetical protein
MFAKRALPPALPTLLLLSACNTMPTLQNIGGGTGQPSAAAAYTQSCLTGAVLGAAVGAAADVLKNGGNAKAVNKNNLVKGAAAGCVIGLAVTAVGKLMDSRQQAKHEDAMQAEVRRRALEQQTYVASTQRAQALPASTPAQRKAKDASLEKARAQYEASIAAPVTVDLGNGGQSTIQVAQPTVANPSRPASCQDYSVLVNTPAGRARQYETWCPDAQGKMVRAEVRDAAG